MDAPAARPTLGLALAGMPVAPLREQLDAATALGYGAVSLNAAAPGLRARDLGRSARRDLASLLRRAGLACCGLDLWIPPEHFAQASTADRAVSAVGDALGLASELAALGAAARDEAPVCIELPLAPAPGVQAALRQHAERAGILLADHAWPVRERPDDAPFAARDVGLDPAAILAAGHDPAATAISLASRIASVRLSDCSRLGARVAPGSPGGRLDLAAFGAALAVAGRVPGKWVTVDIRGVPDAAAQAALVPARWPMPLP